MKKWLKRLGVLVGVLLFAAGVAATSRQRGAVREILSFMASPAAAAVKRRHGMEPA